MLINTAFKALAHPIRRDILKHLRKGAMHAGAFAPLYEISKPSLSSHFSVLKDAGLIVAERDGTHIYYRLNATVADEVLSGVMELLGTGERNVSVAKLSIPAEKGVPHV